MTQYPKVDCKVVSCIGDSITAGFYDDEGLGWVARLSEKIAKECSNRYMFYNFGVANDTSIDAWNVFNTSLCKVHTSILILHIGVNDTCINVTEGSRQTRVAIAESATRWINMLSRAKKEGYVTMAISPLPAKEDEVAYEPYPDNPKKCEKIVYANREILSYVNMLEKLCLEYDVPFLRVYEKWLEQDYYSSDGLHLNAQGHKVLADEVFLGLRKFSIIS